MNGVALSRLSAPRSRDVVIQRSGDAKPATFAAIRRYARPSRPDRPSSPGKISLSSTFWDFHIASKNTDTPCERGKAYCMILPHSMR